MAAGSHGTRIPLAGANVQSATKCVNRELMEESAIECGGCVSYTHTLNTNAHIYTYLRSGRNRIYRDREPEATADPIPTPLMEEGIRISDGPLR